MKNRQIFKFYALGILLAITGLGWPAYAQTVPSGLGEEACIAEASYFENPTDVQERYAIISQIFHYITPEEQQRILTDVTIFGRYETNGLPILTVDEHGQHYFMGVPVTLAVDPATLSSGGGGSGACDFAAHASDVSGNMGTGTTHYVTNASELQAAVNNAQDGDNILLLAGGNYNETPIIIDWSGTANNPVTIGAYHLDANGNPVRGLGGNLRPILDGNYNRPALDSWTPMIRVSGSNIVIEDLELRESGGEGMRVQDTHDIVIRNVKIEETFVNGLMVRSSENVLIENTEISRHNTGYGVYETVDDWGGGLSVTNFSSNVIARNNIVHSGYGEGMNTWSGNSNIIFEGNLVYDNRAVGMYADSSDGVIFRNNMIVGTSDPEYFRGDRAGNGIALNNESFQFQGHGGDLTAADILRNVQIYNNVVIGTTNGLAFFGQYEETEWNNFDIHNNTFIDNNTNIAAFNNRPFNNVSITDNAFFSTDPDSQNTGSMSNMGEINWSGNYWSSAPPGTVSSGTDTVGGATLARPDGFRDIASINQLTPADLVINGGPAGVGADTANLMTAGPCN